MTCPTRVPTSLRLPTYPIFVPPPEFLLTVKRLRDEISELVSDKHPSFHNIVLYITSGCPTTTCRSRVFLYWLGSPSNFEGIRGGAGWGYEEVYPEASTQGGMEDPREKTLYNGDQLLLLFLM